MNLFQNITSESVTVSKPNMGGGYIAESGVDTYTIDAAYITPTKTGGVMFNLILKNDKVTVKFTGRQAFFIMRKDEVQGMLNYKSDPSKIYFGYRLIDELSLVVAGKHLHKLREPVAKYIPMYNFDERAEVPTKVMSFEELRGGRVTVGMVKVIADKTKWDRETSTNVAIGGTHAFNEAKVFFHASTGFSAYEQATGVQEGAELYKDVWAKHYTGKTIDRSTGASKSAGGASSTGSAAPSSISISR